jgi:subtilase family serine protease
MVAATSRNRLNLDVAGTVASIEAALHVTMSVYRHPTENRTFFAPDREPTPDLAFPLWHISGLDNYSIPTPALVRRPEGVIPNATTGSCPSASFCGSDMRAAYYGSGSLTGSGQSLGLLEYAGTDLADLNTYYKNAKQTLSVPITLLSTDGTSTSCVAPSCDDTEQTIDMTQALGMAPGLASLVMYVGSSDSAIFNGMATASPLNAQLSSSWTWTPADPTTDNPYFKEFATQGQTLFQATGDSGRWGRLSEIWPADSAALTGVGGTDLTTSSAGGPWASETAWADGGGGISPHHYPIPSWQTAAASGCSSCSKTYRNGPDVSANANFTFYVCADQTTCTANEIGGTSFAAPMWAGYMALVNQQAVTNTGKTLGFINKALYKIGLSASYPTDFHDITSGSNGYPATAGYDLATGWGSPNGAGLINSLAP